MSALLCGHAQLMTGRELEEHDGGLCAIRHTEAPVNLGEMELDRMNSQLQAASRLGIGQAGGHELQHFELTRGERGEVAPVSGTCSLIEHEIHRKRDACARLRPLGQRFEGMA